MITYIGFEKDEQRFATERVIKQPVDWTDILYTEVYFINEHRIFMNKDLIISFIPFLYSQDKKCDWFSHKNLTWVSSK